MFTNEKTKEKTGFLFLLIDKKKMICMSGFVLPCTQQAFNEALGIVFIFSPFSLAIF